MGWQAIERAGVLDDGRPCEYRYDATGRGGSALRGRWMPGVVRGRMEDGAFVIEVRALR